ncbi:hypothetical protein KSP40_PGU015912 [Platanthera guangdongensis]|uniref:Uncharacterized protein n=1 Tax=Platanthera guangdongensis TaxID=2320717 RepID=A0ABR2LEX9_9ASPA
MMMAFVCLLRREQIEFNLTVFRKLFSYKATPDGVAYFGGSLIKVREIANKHHNCMTKIAFIKGDLGNIPYSPSKRARTSTPPPPPDRVRQRRRAPQIPPPQRFKGRLPAKGPRLASPRPARQRYSSPSHCSAR